jgi:AraC family ethanolamine operon transcriptional activator
MKFRTFCDFDAFVESVHGVESTMLPRNVKRRCWSHASVMLDGVGVQVGRMGSGNIAECQMHSDGFIIYLPLTKSAEYRANGRTLEQDALAILEPSCEVCVSTKVEHDWCGVFVPTHFLAGGKPLASVPGSKPGTVRVSRPTQQIARRLRNITSQVMAAAADYPQFESSPAATRAAGELVNVASLVTGLRPVDNPDRPGRRKVSRAKIIARSKELLEQREGRIVSVGELASAADVSERTLRTAFNEFFGVGPVRYLQLRQLQQVRRALRAADPDAVTVSKILVEHDEWEFGQFAARYRRLFGELPSETLRAGRR